LRARGERLDVGVGEGRVVACGQRGYVCDEAVEAGVGEERLERGLLCGGEVGAAVEGVEAADEVDAMLRRDADEGDGVVRRSVVDLACVLQEVSEGEDRGGVEEVADDL
jgi:hypothetical protein